METKEEETVRGKSVFVEAKYFSFNFSKGTFILMESHMRRERELCLSSDQAKWNGEGWCERNCFFGKTRRKETKSFDGAVFALIETVKVVSSQFRFAVVHNRSHACMI